MWDKNANDSVELRGQTRASATFLCHVFTISLKYTRPKLISKRQSKDKKIEPHNAEPYPKPFVFNTPHTLLRKTQVTGIEFPTVHNSKTRTPHNCSPQKPFFTYYTNHFLYFFIFLSPLCKKDYFNNKELGTIQQAHTAKPINQIAVIKNQSDA